MDYIRNAKLLLWPLSPNDPESNISDHSGRLDVTFESRECSRTVSEQLSQKYPETSEEKISWQEQIRMIHLRSHLNKLAESVRHAQYLADKTKEELKKCHCQIEQHQEERERLCREIKTNESECNKTALQRLEAAYDRVCRELVTEQKLEVVIREKLEQAEYELALAEVEHGKFLVVEDDLIMKEHQMSHEKAESALARLQTEELVAKQATKAKKNERRKQQDALNDAEKRHMQAVEEAERSHERANKYLMKTLAKLKKRQQEEEDRHNTDMNKKMDMLLKLKKDIANNRENLRVIWAREQGIGRQRKLAELEEINQILAKGGNAEEMVLIRRRRNEIEQKKQQFDLDQKVKRADIVQKILQEEENMRRKIKLQPHIFSDPELEKSLRIQPHKKKLPKLLRDHIAAGTDSKGEKTPPKEQQIKEHARRDGFIPDGEDDKVSTDSYLASQEYRKILANMPILYDPQISRGSNLTVSTRGRQSAPDLQNLETAKIESSKKSDKNKNKQTSDEEEGDTDLLETKDYTHEEEEITIDEKEEIEEEPREEEEEGQMEVASTEEGNVLLLSPAEDTDDTDMDNDELQEDLAQPEFEGLWSQQKSRPFKALKEATASAKPVHGSKMEKEIVKRTLDKQREKIVVTQVAAGKVFSGRPFYSKPREVLFKDFVVGKSYKKKLVLTNVSYTVNFIKFLDVSEDIKDFIAVSFEPPGALSAGMTCEVKVNFKPMRNIDLDGHIMFLTQTGPYNIPVHCRIKRCELSLDSNVIDFKTSVIGETLTKSVVLTNRGALATRFRLTRAVDFVPAAASQTSVQDQEPVKEIEAEPSVRMSLAGLMRSRTETLVPTREASHITREASPFNVATSELGEVIQATSDPAVDQANKSSFAAIEPLTLDVQPERDSNADILKESEVEEPADGSPVAPEELRKVSEVGRRVSEGMTRLSEDAQNVPFDTTTTLEDSRRDSEVVNSFLQPAVIQSTEDQVIDDGFEEDQDESLKMKEDFISSLDGIQIGQVSSGVIDAFSSVLLEFHWQPTIPGEINTEFLVAFSDTQIAPLSVYVRGNAIDVPVWIERQTIDLKICMFDRLYQDTVVLNNRSKMAHKLQFEVCPELKAHLEMLPKTGFIQAQTSFAAQLKFLPRQSLFQEAAKFFDPNTGVLEVPVTIRVANQVTPICFVVQAALTTSDLEFDTCGLDFGYCTVHESKTQTIKVTNKSILPQQFGFVGLPEFLEVQPNDGFGTILPLETLEMEVIFSPKMATEYQGTLLCKTLVIREFTLCCHGVGVLTPLELSQQVVHFRATSLYDTSSAPLYVLNNHTSANEYTHRVPRVGNGEVFPVGPTSFEFKVPENASFTISPSVGTVLPGQKQRIEVSFSPTLDAEAIRLEALQIAARIEFERAEKEAEEAARREQELQKLNEEEPVIEHKHKKEKKPNNTNVNSSREEAELNSNINKVETCWEQNFHLDKQVLENWSPEPMPFLEAQHKCDENTRDHVLPGKSAILKNKLRTTSQHSHKNKKTVRVLAEKQTKGHQTSQKHKISQRSPRLSPQKRRSAARPSKGPNVEANKNKTPYRAGIVSGMLSSKKGLKVKRSGHKPAALQHRLKVRNMKKLTTSHEQITHETKAEMLSRNITVRKSEENLSRLVRRLSKLWLDRTRNVNSHHPKSDSNNNKDEAEENLEDLPTSPKEIMEESRAPSVAVLSNVSRGELENDEEQAGAGKKKSSIRSPAKLSQSKLSSQIVASNLASRSVLATEGLHVDSSVQRAAIAALLRQFKNQCTSVTVPCYLASGQATQPHEVHASIHSTLYLQVHCPTVKPSLLVISDEGRRTVDFEAVSQGQVGCRSVTVQNISDTKLELTASALNPFGPFQLLNALRPMTPGAIHTLLLTFTPVESHVFQEKLDIHTQNSTLHLTLKGTGVSPLVKFNFEGQVFDMGAVLSGDTMEKHFVVENLSPLGVKFVFKLDSLSPEQHARAQKIPSFLGGSQTENYVGSQNKSGRTVFDVVPTMGTIKAGETVDITVTFAPDHASDFFSDGIRLDLFDQKESHFFQVVGIAKSRVMYLEGFDLLTPPVDSLAYVAPKVNVEDETASRSVPSPPVLVLMKTLITRNRAEAVVRELFIGCVYSSIPGLKKGGEFQIEVPQTLSPKGFTIQPNKGAVEAGGKKVVTITWQPLDDFSPHEVIADTLMLTLKADTTEQIPVIIRAMAIGHS